MRLDRAASIDDLRDMARRRIPRFAFDLVDGGAESERNMRRNCTAFEEMELVPRYMVDVSKIDTRTEVFGQTYNAPFGMAPIGMLNAFWPGADIALAQRSDPSAGDSPRRAPVARGPSGAGPARSAAGTAGVVAPRAAMT